jgi:AbrB family looped-hinge helix DNA binding protein
MAATIRTTIDAGGRVVIPKPFRDELGLRPGTPVDVIVDGLEIRIATVEPEIELVRKGRVLVARRPGVPKGSITDEMVLDAIDADREAQLRRFR